jgi:Reverse transcriptase (RNA-dependent DNA polymerase)
MNLLTILIVYVDDITLLENSLNQIKEVKKLIATSFEISDLGEISYFLGLCVICDQSQHIIDLDQLKYISDVLAQFQMTSAMPTQTLFATGTQLSVNPEPPSKNDPEFVIFYQGLVGSLMYAMLGTRPHISYAITKLSQFLSNPT